MKQSYGRSDMIPEAAVIAIAAGSFAIVNNALLLLKDAYMKRRENGKTEPRVVVLTENQRRAIYEGERISRDTLEVCKANADLLQQLTRSAMRMQDRLGDIRDLMRQRGGGST